jgi:hypothetical protein
MIDSRSRRRNNATGPLSGVVRSVEQIVLALIRMDVRVIGFIAPHGTSVVSFLSRDVAEMFAKSGVKTLLLETSSGTASYPCYANWLPGDMASTLTVACSSTGVDRLLTRPTPSAMAAFTNVPLLRKTFSENFSAYQKIIVELPPLLETGSDVVNPLAIGAACDAVLLICERGVSTEAEIIDSVELARSAGVNLAGIVSNELNYLTTGADIARSVSRWLGSGRFSKWLQKRLKESHLLNS